MNRLKSVLLAAFTLLLVAAGAAMPYAVCHVQDRRQTDAEIRSFESFRLTLRQKSDLGQALRTLAGEDCHIAEAQRSEAATRSGTEAAAAAEEILAGLVKYGLLDKRVLAEAEVPAVRPQTLFSGDGSVSIPTWNVEWGRENLYIWLDDLTGKALYIDVPYFRDDELPSPESATPPAKGGNSQQTELVFDGADREELYIRMENWGQFLVEHYGMEIKDLEECAYDNGGVRFLFYFDLEDGGPPFPMGLYLSPVYGYAWLFPCRTQEFDAGPMP